MDADEKEAVDGEEQQDDDEDDAGSAVSVEQSGPPVGLYLKDSISVLSTFISCPAKNEEFLHRSFHTISACPSPQNGSRSGTAARAVLCAIWRKRATKCPTTVAKIAQKSRSRGDLDLHDVLCGQKRSDFLQDMPAGLLDLDLFDRSNKDERFLGFVTL